MKSQVDKIRYDISLDATNEWISKYDKSYHQRLVDTILVPTFVHLWNARDEIKWKLRFWYS